MYKGVHRCIYGNEGVYIMYMMASCSKLTFSSTKPRLVEYRAQP